MRKYWQDPRLDDEGTYDYLVEELPSDIAKWQWWYEKCDSCGKYHRVNFVSTHYFYCWDGWDSMSYTECWRCKLKFKIYGVKTKIKKQIKQHREYRWYIKLLKAKSVPITKEIKAMARKLDR